MKSWQLGYRSNWAMLLPARRLNQDCSWLCGCHKQNQYNQYGATSCRRYSSPGSVPGGNVKLGLLLVPFGIRACLDSICPDKPQEQTKPRALSARGPRRASASQARRSQIQQAI